MDEFPQLKSVNSQQGEQINRSLHSLATVLAHLRWETYLKVLELYFVHRNLRVKKYRWMVLFSVLSFWEIKIDHTVRRMIGKAGKESTYSAILRK